MEYTGSSLKEILLFWFSVRFFSGLGYSRYVCTKWSPVKRQCKEITSLYFGLDVFCLLEAGVPEFDKLYTSTPALVYKWERFPLWSCGSSLKEAVYISPKCKEDTAKVLIFGLTRRWGVHRCSKRATLENTDLIFIRFCILPIRTVYIFKRIGADDQRQCLNVVFVLWTGPTYTFHQESSQKPRFLASSRIYEVPKVNPPSCIFSTDFPEIVNFCLKGQ
jgi:hypothetical protein